MAHLSKGVHFRVIKTIFSTEYEIVSLICKTIRPKKIPVFTVGVPNELGTGGYFIFTIVFFYFVIFSNENNICVARIKANTTRKYFNVGKTRTILGTQGFFRDGRKP